MEAESAVRSLEARSMEAFCRNSIHVIGLASTPIPTAAGMAISMVVLTACAVFSLAPSMSPCPTLAAMLGSMAEDIAEEIAMGILDITTALAEKIP